MDGDLRILTGLTGLPQCLGAGANRLNLGVHVNNTGGLNPS